MEKHQAKKLQTLRKLLLITSFTLPSFSYGADKLPEKMDWQTAKNVQPIGSPQAKKGGTIYDYLLSFPLTLRQVGPDSNGGFRSALDSNDLSLLTIHPNTDEYIPILATAWSFSKDGKTVYYKLNKLARWSDGKPVKATDFTFTREFMTSKHIIAPWYNQYYSTEISAVKAYTDEAGEEIVAVTLPSPKPDLLYFTNIRPIPRHFYKLDENFVKNYNWKLAPNTGPYKITEVRKGKSITFERKEKWWGDQLSWFKHRYNPSKIRYKVIRDINVAFENLKKGNIDYMGITFPDFWHIKTKDKMFEKGYIHKLQAYNDAPRSDYVLILNQKIDVLKDKKVRVAFQHAMNVDKVINQVLRGDYRRLQGISRGYGDYSNPNIKARLFDLKKADKLLDEAGWSKRNGEGIRVKNGRALSVTVSYGQANLAPRLVVLREEAKKAGIDLKLKQLDPSALWKSYLEKKHEIAFVSWSTGFRPQYWGQFHSENANKPQTNNFSNTAIPELDKLIETYRSTTSESKRIESAHAIQKIIHDEATHVPLFEVPYYRIAYWSWVQFPEPTGTRRTQGFDHFATDTGGLYWIDEKIKKEILSAKKSGKALRPVTRLDETYLNESNKS